MAWDDIQSSGETITFAEWNNMVGEIKKYWPLSSAIDLNSFNSADWHNSSLIWSNTSKKWLAYKSGAGVGISNVVEDTTPQLGGDLDGNTHGLNDITYLSSQNISGGTIIGSTLTTNSYISSQQGLYTNFISANTTNLTITDTSWSGAQGYWPVSSMVNVLDSWYDASSSKLSALSGSLSTRIDSKIDGTTVSSNFFTVGSGNSLYDWSSNALNVYGASSHTHSIEDLSDVAEMTPTDGKALIWDDIQSMWSSQSTSDADVAWSGASEFYAVSSMVNILDDWYDVDKEQLTGKDLFEEVYTQYLTSGVVYTSISSQNISSNIIKSYKLEGNPYISSQISGTQLITKLYPSKPDVNHHTGEIIRVSGSGSDKTYVFMAVRKSDASNQWIQIGISS